jgi:hypothetical protein
MDEFNISKKSRLRKKASGGDDFSSPPMGIIIPDFQDKITDKRNGITYGPSISKEWTSDKDIDNPEWMLRQEIDKNF